MDHPVLSCREAGELEGELLGGDSGREWDAMGRAGGALAAAVRTDFLEIADFPEKPRLLVLAGKGHNAGDALIAARVIVAERPGSTVDVLFPLGEETLNPLARRAWNRLSSAAGNSFTVRALSVETDGEADTDLPGQLKEICGGHYHLFLDGLFGMNFRPPFRSPMDRVADWMNDSLDADLRAAVDLPSGLSDQPTDRAIRADFTYMTGIAKQPLFEMANAGWAGRLRYLDIGFFSGSGEATTKFFLPPDAKDGPSDEVTTNGSDEGPSDEVTTSGSDEEFSGEVTTSGAASGSLARRRVMLPNALSPIRRLRDPMTHKRKYGHLLIVGGSRQMPGAILMSIMAAARSGVGLLTAAVPESLVASFATVVPEAMWIGIPETRDGGLSREGFPRMKAGLGKADAVLMGPGVGTGAGTQAFMEELVGGVDVPLVVDAEALQPKVIDRIRSRSEMRGRVVITPHMGEFARITGKTFADVGEDGLMEFSQNSGIVTVLKGPPFTRLCDGKSIGYGLAGGPVLARGGSGDILSGILGSQVAGASDGVVAAARRAIVWHGLAAAARARAGGQEAVRTTQLLDFLPRVSREIVPE